MADLCEAMKKFGKGIGSVPRYRILETLFAGQKTVGEIVAATGLSQPLVSQHLHVLKQSDLVVDRRRGQEVVYSFNAEQTVRLLKNLSNEFTCRKQATNIKQ